MEYERQWLVRIPGMRELVAVAFGIPLCQELEACFDLELAMPQHVFFFGLDHHAILAGLGDAKVSIVRDIKAFLGDCILSKLSRFCDACMKIRALLDPKIDGAPCYILLAADLT